MKNMWLYGMSDDCREIETDFGLREERYDDIAIFHNTGVLIAHYEFDGDWGIQLIGEIPKTWQVKAITANAPFWFRDYDDAGQFIHVQMPDEESVSLRPVPEDKVMEHPPTPFAVMKKKEIN